MEQNQHPIIAHATRVVNSEGSDNNLAPLDDDFLSSWGDCTPSEREAFLEVPVVRAAAQKFDVAHPDPLGEISQRLYLASLVLRSLSNNVHDILDCDELPSQADVRSMLGMCACLDHGVAIAVAMGHESNYPISGMLVIRQRESSENIL